MTPHYPTISLPNNLERQLLNGSDALGAGFKTAPGDLWPGDDNVGPLLFSCDIFFPLAHPASLGGIHSHSIGAGRGPGKTIVHRKSVFPR